ncbi:RES family NAD+ phosphorylase [Pseudomonas sp. 10B1]|uniref:RES family NAD+ phosphorylase n=1 Tax=unclassified Pseudomonas TaxID=196821 RepID=UPI002B237D4D|nr:MULTISPECIES: RES family NAD+ phosphorylase [unclassified Pseudomonas]MEA9975929.1 RES family NAD+ phosphorylase [Pseudomonas sp. RTS4]MEA9993234.1 RES family NAD+ phosphorylase [Pseudomonas sp. AA4]MEB0088058.1 RES family NAD+ phosphorylase [Pseudomonas sp. RTI1]MEB0124279.1 RES family NAD+ phosphorylase [Pseudomonas sp. CCC1.2]MEB0151955.1 RES family NAD+ phosphorylase [Pseudomonas sp. CCC4.3]
MILPKQEIPAWDNAYRIISSSFPPITLFEDILDPSELQVAYALESLTNDRLAEQAGVISRVSPEDCVSGPGSTPVMAAFTHIGRVSRFTDGTFGIYYAANSQTAAIAETSFHQERFLAATQEPDVELTMRTYVNKVVKPMHDIRADFGHLHDPDPAHYGIAQAFAKKLREAKSWGILYNSVRATGHECIAAFRPTAVSIPVQGKHIRYVWDAKSQKIGCFFEITPVI